MTSPQGFWSLVLHAHLPYVHHPEYPDFLEEDWFFEALIETYIPILDFSQKLAQEGVYFKYAINLSPTLCAMMQDSLLQERAFKHIQKLHALSLKEIDRCSKHQELLPIAQMYERKLRRAQQILSDNQGDLTRGYKTLQESSHIEILTCCATHGFLPLMIDRRAQEAQIRVGVESYWRTFNRAPRGIWLAECAYAQGVDEILSRNNLQYFLMDSHGLTLASPTPPCGTFEPIYTPSGVAAFARDQETANQVWSAEQGYPGDARYRDFYRDLGYDLAYDYVRPYLHEDGVRRNIGLKYHRITGKVPLGEKQYYNPDWARQAAADHAGNFLFNRQHQVQHLRHSLKKEPLIVSMYDAELYGHWWYEGPEFLEYVFRKMHYDQDTILPVTPSEYLSKFPVHPTLRVADSSWGDKGYYEVWLNSGNDWIYRHLHKIAQKMITLAQNSPSPTPLQKRALNQMAREVLLAQASDWAFLMTADTAKQYSVKRTKDHVHRFLALESQFLDHTIDSEFLNECEQKDNIFPWINYKVFC